MKNDFNLLNSKYKEAIEINDEIVDENNKLKDAIEDQERKISKLKMRNNDLENENSNLNTELNTEQSREITSLKREKDQLERGNFYKTESQPFKRKLRQFY